MQFYASDICLSRYEDQLIFQFTLNKFGFPLLINELSSSSKHCSSNHTRANSVAYFKLFLTWGFGMEYSSFHQDWWANGFRCFICPIVISISLFMTWQCRRHFSYHYQSIEQTLTVMLLSFACLIPFLWWFWINKHSITPCVGSGILRFCIQK